MNDKHNNLELKNKIAKFDASTNSYCMNWIELPVKPIPSVKNTQYSLQDCNEVLFQFVKLKDDEYQMTIREPISVLQGFCLCLFNFDKIV